MPAYIRKVKRKNGSVSVQIEYKSGRTRTALTHIGTAHNELEVKFLSALAHMKIHEGQISTKQLQKRVISLTGRLISRGIDS